jgi:hypothetical protein
MGFNPRITVAPNHFPSRQRRLNSTVNANPLCIRTVAPTFLCVGMPVLFGDIQPRSVVETHTPALKRRAKFNRR